MRSSKMRFLALALFAAASVAACSKPPDNAWQGYIEGEFGLLASPYAGQLQKLYVRRAEREAAEFDVQASKAALAQAAWRLEQKSVGAPVSGVVQDTFFVEGEWVPAGRPVASLLPPGNVKARFYVPEAVVGSLTAGR